MSILKFWYLNMDINKEIGNKVAKLRREAGFTIEDLAWQGGLSKSCTASAEKGENDVRISTIAGICASLNISLAEFFSTFDEVPEVKEKQKRKKP